MKGYAVSYGYMGHIGNGRYLLFATEEEYREWFLGNN